MFATRSDRLAIAGLAAFFEVVCLMAAFFADVGSSYHSGSGWKIVLVVSVVIALLLPIATIAWVWSAPRRDRSAPPPTAL